LIPTGLRGIDKEVTWGKSNVDGWIYSHGIFSLASHSLPLWGCFIWMKNSVYESKRLWLETSHYKCLVEYISMDSKADDYALFREFNSQRRIPLVTYCRDNMDKTEKRQEMINVMSNPSTKPFTKSDHIVLSRYRD
jgi:hypothetical protein